MQNDYHFKQLPSSQDAADLKTEWLNTLTRPQDGMWDSLRSYATHWAIEHAEKMIGYCCVDGEQQLLQFYVSPPHLNQSTVIFQQLLEQLQIKQALVGTNNPIYLSAALHAVQHMEIHSYLFNDQSAIVLAPKAGKLSSCQAADLNRIVDFCHYSTGAPKAWLNGYIGDLIEKQEVFVLEEGEAIIGTCEVRKSKTHAEFADIGMIVSPDYRKQGYGSSLLNQAKSIALEWKKTPICSCEKGNIGSQKSIHKNGFTSLHQLLSMSF